MKTADFLRAQLFSRKNILICGKTGTGKTTLMRALLSELPDTERVITIEDTPELHLRRPQCVSLFSRHSPDELVPTITLDNLLKNSLRMRPDRIVVGEIRDQEALTYLDGISTGHGGSLSSIHGGSAHQSLKRLENLVLRAAGHWPLGAIRQLIFESVNELVVLERKEKGRRVVELARLAGLETFGFLIESNLLTKT